MIEARVAGIPCLINPTHVLVVAPNHNSDNSGDYYGYSEIEYEVCDLRGRPAPWLQRKMTDKDRDAVENLILEQDYE